MSPIRVLSTWCNCRAISRKNGADRLTEMDTQHYRLSSRRRPGPRVPPVRTSLAISTLLTLESPCGGKVGPGLRRGDAFVRFFSEIDRWSGDNFQSGLPLVRSGR